MAETHTAAAADSLDSAGIVGKLKLVTKLSEQPLYRALKLLTTEPRLYLDRHKYLVKLVWITFYLRYVSIVLMNCYSVLYLIVNQYQCAVNTFMNACLLEFCLIES